MVISKKVKDMDNNIAIIPARGGSKRIPKKNIVDFNGKPMIAWTIEAAINSKIFTKVIVSTDSDEIAEISREYGADVPFLRSGLSDDITPVSEATCAALIQAEECWGTNFDTVTQLMANCPLRTKTDIVDFHDEYFTRDVNFLLSCFKFGWMNPWWAFKLDDNDQHTFLFNEALKSRSQDLDHLYCPTGSIWVADAKALKRECTFHGVRKQFCQIDWVAAIDIDDEDDLRMAKLISQNSFDAKNT